ncbi:MAG TPA: hypothetical protein VIK18_02745 [Pirellulales bacterium]
MIATAHPIAEVLSELLAQYEARGLLAADAAGARAAPLREAWNPGAAPVWTGMAELHPALSACGG